MKLLDDAHVCVKWGKIGDVVIHFAYIHFTGLNAINA